ncbi:hypothetical protein DPEC_G00167120 [Dallia pectoralis]|uniref:Uncharacterized protein n=1 Tax=Dallia pectoralis TaxID=75939 RepID=A0ACC2GIC0_DALPE|nr:hypothetical protein DPEC_G00167120 [Dallia pectoralis]
MELERLTNQRIIEPVKFSEWAAPIVPVLKPDDSVRICGDYKLTVNQVLKLEQYPIPRLEDLLEQFPAIFQRLTESLVSGIPNVVVYLDDILLTGQSDQDHLAMLNQVLKRLQEAASPKMQQMCVHGAGSRVSGA